jgi:hypothetical protein
MRAGHRSCVYYRSSFVSHTQGYQALYVFLELSLPLFRVVEMLAHSINMLVLIGLEVSLQQQASKPPDARVSCNI